MMRLDLYMFTTAGLATVSSLTEMLGSPVFTPSGPGFLGGAAAEFLAPATAAYIIIEDGD